MSEYFYKLTGHIINILLSKLGFRLIKDSPLGFYGDKLNQLYCDAPWIKLWLEFSASEKRLVLPYLCDSHSQLGQDLLAIVLRRKRSYLNLGNEIPEKGYFVEIGASDGARFSNSMLLETYYDWIGICSEPSKFWYDRLVTNRKCIIDTRAVFRSSGQLVDFIDISERNGGYPELSGITEFNRSHKNSKFESIKNSSYKVETISLTDLLIQHSAPSYIDFLSIDTEGSELSILEGLDFGNYSFGLICVEHNYIKQNRDNIYKLLTSKSYRRVLTDASAWDDWYVPADTEWPNETIDNPSSGDFPS